MNSQSPPSQLAVQVALSTHSTRHPPAGQVRSQVELASQSSPHCPAPCAQFWLQVLLVSQSIWQSAPASHALVQVASSVQSTVQSAPLAEQVASQLLSFS